MSLTRNPYRSDVYVGEWALVAPYLTLLREAASQREHALWQVFDGVLYVIRRGCSWRLMSRDQPLWVVVYQQAWLWLSASCFEQLAEDVRAVLRMAAVRAS